MSSGEHPLSISMEPDGGAIKAWQDAARGLVKPEQVNRSLAMAVNRALSSARTEAVRQARAQYVISRDDLLKHAKEKKASATRLSAELKFTGSRIPLLEFKVNPADPNPYRGMSPSDRPGLKKVQIRKDGGGPAPHLFVQDLGYGPAVYKRESKGKYHLTKETGPSVVSMVGNDIAREGIQSKAQEVLLQRVDHEMGRLLNK